MNKELYDYYARYIALGWSVIPIHPKSKHSIISWRQAQKRKHTLLQAADWAHRWTNSGIAVVTGELSRVIVIDVDTAEALESPFIRSLPQTAMAKTSKGRHYYFRPPLDTFVPTKVKFLPGIDCRGEAGYAVLPPSEHESGAIYEWLAAPELGIADLPQSVLDAILGRRGTLESFVEHGETRWRSHLEGVTEGSRNDAAASLIGKLLAESPVELWEAMCWKYVNDEWNFRNVPPLPTDELRRTFDSIARKEMRARTQRPAVIITEGIDAADIVIEEREATFAISGLIVEGLTLLIGKPKRGKSTLAQQMALDVAAGDEFLWVDNLEALGRPRRFPTVKGRVLHLALEDNAQSYKRRALNLLAAPHKKPFPKGISTYYEWPDMFAGGIEALDKTLTDKPDIRLVIIDSAARFVGGKSPKASTAFAMDYETYRPLHELALKHKRAIMVLVHARKDSALKTVDSDPMDSVSGTLGIMAAADHTIVMSRYHFDSSFGEISVTGRDIKAFSQSFNQKGWRFQAATPQEIAEYIESKKPARKAKVAA